MTNIVTYKNCFGVVMLVPMEAIQKKGEWNLPEIDSPLSVFLPLGKG